MTTKEHSPRKKLFSEWTNWGVIAIGIALLLLGLPMTLWLMTYRSSAAVTMWVVTWLCLTFFVLLMAKKSVSDPGYYVDKKIIDRTRQEINAHRQSVRKEILANEIKTLSRGEKTPVLDVWRLDESLAKRHRFFTSTTSLVMDPRQRELHVRVQISEVCQDVDDRKVFFDTLFKDIIAYLRVISQDAYLFMEKSFFDRFILVIDSLHEDERHIDTPYPIVSMSVKAVGLWSIKMLPEFDMKHLQMIAEIRFNNGNEIQPHRIIGLPSARGLK